MVMPDAITPLLVIAYRRHDLLANLLENLPNERQVYVVVDGPARSEHLKDVAMSQSVVSRWSSSRPKTSIWLRDHNMGGPDGIPAAIDWALSEEQSICILEEDCVPSSLSYRYIDRVLDQLQHRPDLAGGTLNNFVAARRGLAKAQPIISLFPHCWGWFISKKSWQAIRPHRNDFGPQGEISHRNELSQLLKHTFPGDADAQFHWMQIMQRLIRQEIYHWDYAMTLKMWNRGLKFIAPPINLCSNIGHGEQALNCKKASKNHYLALPTEPRAIDLLNFTLPNQGSYRYRDFDRADQRTILSPWPWRLLQIRSILKLFVRRVLRLQKQL